MTYWHGPIIDKDTGLAAAVSARVQTPTGNALQVQIGPGDVISNIPVMLDYAHHQIHEGETYEWSWFGDLNGATKDVRISVPALAATTRTPHLLIDVISDCTTVTIGLFEGTTWTSGGTDDSANIINQNYNVATAASTKIYVSGTTTLTPNAVGTQKYWGYLFASGRTSLASERSVNERDLKTSTEYLFRVVTTGNGKVLIRLHFYEDRGV